MHRDSQGKCETLWDLLRLAVRNGTHFVGHFELHQRWRFRFENLVGCGPMVRLTYLQPAMVVVALASSSACSKSRSDYFNSEEAALRYREGMAARPVSSADGVLQALDAGTLTLNDPDPLPNPEVEKECPATTGWQTLEGKPDSCNYVWTRDKASLPISPEWHPCETIDGIARNTCKTLGRHHRLKSIHVGLDESKKVQIGFVEACTTDQIILTDADGTAQIALRNQTESKPETTCQVKLLAVDFGQWLAALGGHDPAPNFNTPGYTLGGAFVGGNIEAAPSILHSTKTDPFHVATSQGTIGSESWTADGKRRSWNGGAFQKSPGIGWQHASKDIFFDAKKGFYSAKKKDPLVSVDKGTTIRYVHVRDKQMVWLEESSRFGPKTCALQATEIEGRDTLTTPRRVAEIPCPTHGFVFGCQAVLSSNDTQLSLVSLTSGATRILRIRGRAAAVDCENAFIERGGTLLRVNLAAFGVPKLQGPVAQPR